MGELILPFKPFSLDEVRVLTDCPVWLMDQWVDKVVPLSQGLGATGLGYMETFAIFVGKRYVDEGAPESRARQTVFYTARLQESTMQAEIKAGRSFPVPASLDPSLRGAGFGMMIKPPESKLGRDLNLETLLAQFKERVEKVFPRG